MATSKKIIGKGYTKATLPEETVRTILAQAFEAVGAKGKRLLFIIPDATRTAPLPMLFRLIHELLGEQAKALDFLVALGTHMPMNAEALDNLLGIAPGERKTRYARTKIFNHEWSKPETFRQAGNISADEIKRLSGGLLAKPVNVTVNKLVYAYDLVVLCGPVFPHEVVGFSGGNKYLFPGISGPEVINLTHWLGALITSFKVIGTKSTPVREVINRAAACVQVPKFCLAFVVQGHDLAGLYCGTPEEAWSAAADLSSKLHLVHVKKPFKQALAIMPAMYDDLWTAAKGMYKLEPVIAEGGEVIIYAPHINEISYTHGKVIDEIGYHVRDYFVKQWARFEKQPWGVLAHSTHVRGMGTFEDGVEQPRISVTLATGIPEERCRKVNLGYRDPRTIKPEEFANREAEGILLVKKAGEMLYRLKGQ